MPHIFGSWPDLANIDLDQFGFGTNQIELIPDERYRVLFDHICNIEDYSADAGAIWGSALSGHEQVISNLRVNGFEAFKGVVMHLFATPLTHGFAQGPLVTRDLQTREDAQLHVATIILNRLYRLAEAVGVFNVCNPEHHQSVITVQGIDDLFDRIRQRVGFDLSPPRVNGAQFGLRVGGNVLSERHFDGIYSAWRIKELLAQRCGKILPVCEIGGGAGFLAHYARRAGIHDYCIIDFPTVAIVQYMTLAWEIGADGVHFGPSANGVSLISADRFENDLNFSRFGFVVNVDSLPEMSAPVARAYLEAAARSGGLFSINQESAATHMDFQHSVVRELCNGLLKPVYRFPSWLRMGWVEELFEPAGPGRSASGLRGTSQ